MPLIASPCLCCGGKQAVIRGRHPSQPERVVCPTCVVERLEELVLSIGRDPLERYATKTDIGLTPT